MKKHIFACFVCLALTVGTLSSAIAVPVGNSNLSREYLLGATDLSKWSFGLYSYTRERKVMADWLPPNAVMKSSRLMGYVGYDFIPWITTYVTAGSSKTRLHNVGYTDSESAYGAGAIVNILDHEVRDATLFEDRIRINAACQFTLSKMDTGTRETKWREMFASLTVSVVNDLVASKLFVPNSIALFGGPVYSDLSSSSLDEDGKIGFVAGLEVFLTEKVSIDVEIEKYESDTYITGLNIRF